MLLCEYALGAERFDDVSASFIKSAKTCAKKAGISEEQLFALSRQISKANKSKKPEEYIIKKYREVML